MNLLRNSNTEAPSRLSSAVETAAAAIRSTFAGSRDAEGVAIWMIRTAILRSRWAGRGSRGCSRGVRSRPPVAGGARSEAARTHPSPVAWDEHWRGGHLHRSTARDADEPWDPPLVVGVLGAEGALEVASSKKTPSTSASSGSATRASRWGPSSRSARRSRASRWKGSARSRALNRNRRHLGGARGPLSLAGLASAEARTCISPRSAALPSVAVTLAGRDERRDESYCRGPAGARTGSCTTLRRR